MYERKVLHAAVMRPLEVIDPLHHHNLKFGQSFLWSKSVKSVECVFHVLGNGVQFPVPMQGTAPTRFDLSSARHQNEKQTQAQQVCRDAICQPFLRLDEVALRLSHAIGPGTEQVKHENAQEQFHNEALSNRIVDDSQAQIGIRDEQFGVSVQVEIDRLILRDEDQQIPVVCDIGCAKYERRATEDGIC